MSIIGQRRFRRTVLTAAVLISIAVGIGATTFREFHHHGSPNTKGTVSVGQRATVTVNTQSIAEVVSLPAAVVASPVFLIGAINAASLSPAAGVIDGAQISAGQALFTQAGVTVRSPVAATVVSWLIARSAKPTQNLPVLSLRYNGFGLSATLTAEDGYRILANPVTTKGEITNGPGPFDCVFLPTASAAQQPTGAGTASVLGSVQVVCAIPRTVRAFDGLPGLLSVTSGEAENALVLPTFSVIGSVDEGHVYILEKNGNATQRTVHLGITNGGSVQITSGLHAGDKVLANPPAFGASS